MTAHRIAYWLLKTEPSTYSCLDLEKDGKTIWDGVKNALALRYLKEFRKDDRAIIYHTGDEKAAVAVALVTRDSYTDSRPGHEPLPVIDLSFESTLDHPVSLKRIKADPAFSGFPLVRLPRLSVMPVTETEWDRIMRLSRSAE